MKNSPGQLKLAIAALEARQASAVEMLARVRELLDRAEERRHAEPADAKRWIATIDRLESSMVDGRRRLEVLDVELKRAQNAYAAAISADASAPTGEVDLPDGETPSAPVLSSDPAVAVRQLLELPLEQLASLNLEQVSQLHSQIATEDVQARLADLDQATTRLEVASQSIGPSLRSAEAPPERRGQEVLRQAIGKVQAGHLERLLRAEIAMVISCFELLDRKIEPTPSDLRLRALLAPVIPQLRIQLRISTR
jgi:hypothetical protein